MIFHLRSKVKPAYSTPFSKLGNVKQWKGKTILVRKSFILLNGLICLHSVLD